MAEIIDRLYVGGDREYERVQGNAGWSFLRCCKEGLGGHRQLLGYHTLAAPKGANYLWYRKGNILALNVLDLDDPSFISKDMIDQGIAFVQERLDAGDKVLIACNQGHSRGPTITLLYLRTIGEMPHNFIKAERIFRTLYPKYDPGSGMRGFARSHWYDYGRTQ